MAFLGGLAALALVTAGGAQVAPAPQSLDVKSIILLDDAGNARAKWSMSEGGPRLSFADASGHARFVVGEDSGGSPIFAMADEEGGVRTWMTIEPFGPSVNLKDAAGRVRTSLTVVSSDRAAVEGPSIDLFDANLQDRVVLRANETEASLRVSAGAGAGYAGLRWIDGPRVDLVDGKGVCASTLPELPDVALEQHRPVLAVQRHPHDPVPRDAPVAAELPAAKRAQRANAASTA